jgi:histone demethylase JARID1
LNANIWICFCCIGYESLLTIPLIIYFVDWFIQIVHEEGGFENACKERKWAKIAVRCNYPNGKGIGSTLRGHYEKIIYPFDIFQIGATTAECNFKEETPAAPEIKEEALEVVPPPEIKEEPKEKEKEEDSSGRRSSKRIAKEVSQLINR